jgi:hypothetical protein
MMGFCCNRDLPEPRRALRPRNWQERAAQYLQGNDDCCEIECRWSSERKSARALSGVRVAVCRRVRNLLDRKQRESRAVRSPLSFRLVDQPASHTAAFCLMQSFKRGIEIVCRRRSAPPLRREDVVVLGGVEKLRCAPPLRAPGACGDSDSPIASGDHRVVIAVMHQDARWDSPYLAIASR